MATSNTMNIMIYEIFEKANEMLKVDKAAGIEFLQNNRSRVVIEGLLKLNYDSAVTFHLPPGIAPYKKQVDVPDGYCLTDLKQEFSRMCIFTNGELNVTRVRREQLWLQMCEGLFWKEAELINKIKDRRLTDLYGTITIDIAREAFPSLVNIVASDPVPDTVIVPVDFGDDPSKISEEELIKASVNTFLAEQALEEGDLTFDEWREKYYVVPVGLKAAFSLMQGVNVDAELDRLAHQEYDFYVSKVEAAKKASAVSKNPVETTTAQKTPRKKSVPKAPAGQSTPPRKKPGPKPKVQEPVVQERKKPGRKPKTPS